MAEEISVNLTKTRTILTHKGDDDDLYARFLSDTEDGDPRHVLYMERDLWHEMGTPATVTVTVEPGDLLNEGDEHV